MVVQLVRGGRAQVERETEEARLLERRALRVTARARVRRTERDLLGRAERVRERQRRLLDKRTRTCPSVCCFSLSLRLQTTQFTAHSVPTAASSFPSVVAPMCSERQLFSSTVIVKSVSSRFPELAALNVLRYERIFTITLPVCRQLRYPIEN